MDINETNKMSVTALFSKLTSRFEFGVGKGFASFLSRVGEAGLRSDASEGVSQSSPVENKVSKPRSVDLSEDKARNVPSENQVEDKLKNKKTVRSDSGDKAVSGKSTSTVAAESSEVKENKNAAPEDVEYNAQVVIPVVQNLNLTAEAGEGNAFEGVLVTNGVMADDAVFKGAETAAWEAEALPSGVVSFSGEGEDNNGGVSDLTVLQAEASQGDDVALVENTVGVSSVFENVSDETVGQKVFQFDGEQKLAEEKHPAGVNVDEEMSLVKNGDFIAEKSSSEVEMSDKGSLLNQAAVYIPGEMADNTEEKPVIGVSQVKHEIPSEQTSGLRSAVKEVDADKNAEKQAAQLESMLDGQQLKVSVDVKEEKIAEHAGRNLIKDRLVLDEAIADMDNSGNEILSDDMVEVNGSSVLAKMSETSQPQMIVASQQTAVADDVTVKGSAEISKIGTIGAAGNNAAHAAGAGSSEYANTVRNQADSKANETSFRDVFKGMSKEAVEQVKVNITKSAVKGVDNINVHLKPEELGRIEVKMQIKDGKLHAQIISSRPETMEALQREAQVLEKAFNDAGFQTDENSLTFSYRNEGQQEGQNQGRENPLRSFIGEVFETEANGELLSAEAANQNWSAEKGLNIRV